MTFTGQESQLCQVSHPQPIIYRVSILPHLSTADHIISISLSSIRVGGCDRSAGWKGELEATRCCAHMQEAALWQGSVESRRANLWYESATPVSCLEVKSCTRSRSSNNRYPRLYRDLHHQFLTFPVDGRYSNGSSTNGGIPDRRRYFVGRHLPSLQPARLLDSWSTPRLRLEQRWMPAIHRLISD